MAGIEDLQESSKTRAVAAARVRRSGGGRRALTESDLVVQRNELAGITQHSFSRLGVAEARDTVPPLAPFGEPDRLSLALCGRVWSKDDLKQSPDIRQRHTGLGFFSQDAAVAGPGTKAPT
jgi:hypothetical protein